MRILLLLSAVITAFLLSCSGSTEQGQNEKPQLPFELSGKRRVVLPDHFYKQMSGNIEGVAFFSMEMQRKDSILIGQCTYYFMDSSLSFEFEGTIDSLSSVKIIGINDTSGYPDSYLSASFVGEFTSDSTFEGKWMEKKGGKEHAFSCKDDYHKGAALIVIKHKEMQTGKCGANDRGNECSTISFTYPVILKWQDTAAQRRINEAILAELPGDPKKDIKDRMRDFFADPETAPGSSWKEDYTVLYDNAYILSFKQTSVSHAAGTAHPMYGHSLFSYDLRNGKQIELDDIFVAGYKAKLNAVGEEIFRNGKKGSLSDLGWDFPNNRFELNDNFSITPKGLLFIFNPDEVGPFAAGAPEVLIPYHRIKELLKKESVLPTYLHKDSMDGIEFK